MLDRARRTSKAGGIADHEADGRAAGPLLTLGRVDLLRVQVGYRAGPEGPAYEQFLLDVPVLGDERILAALEPVLYAGSDAPRHYSVHQHRWHTSWGASPGVLEIGLLVTTGSGTAAVSREAAIVRARRGAATAYGLDRTPSRSAPRSTTRPRTPGP